MVLTLAGGISMCLSFCDTAKTPGADSHDFLVLSHRTKFKLENDALE
jgi:hypothetical protein